jgi:hypothetical protein
MILKYKCTDPLCREKNQTVHRVDLPAEMVMDDRNMATLYCPKCKRKLTRVE